MRGLIDRMTRKGRVVKTVSLRGFLLLYMVAAFKPLRPRSLRYQVEQRIWRNGSRPCCASPRRTTISRVEVAAARNLVKGYGDTHERGRARFER